MRVLGIDAGHYSYKAVMLEDGEITVQTVMRLPDNADTASKKIMEEVLREINCSAEDIENVVATGFGRRGVSIANESCAIAVSLAKAGHALESKARTIIDIGAENCEAIKIDGLGKLRDYEENDKCAGGCGVFLDTMADFLELTVDQMSAMAFKTKGSVQLTSQCAIFAEQELITHIHKNPPTPLEDLVGAIYQAIARRLSGFVKRISPEDAVVLVGGVAKNKGFCHMLEQELGFKLHVPPYPELGLAYGAALIAQERLKGA